MTFPDITPDLRANMPDLRGRLAANQQLAPFTWFRVGGPAQVLFQRRLVGVFRRRDIAVARVVSLGESSCRLGETPVGQS